MVPRATLETVSVESADTGRITEEPELDSL